MAAPQRSPARAVLAVTLLLLFLPQPTVAQPLPDGRLLPLAVRQGRCECVIPSPRPDDKFILIIGSLSRDLRSLPVRVQPEATDRPIALDLDQPVADEAWARHIHEVHDRLSRVRKGRPLQDGPVPHGDPPRQRVFSVFVKEQDFRASAGYVNVTAELRGCGRRCQVYVDRDHPDPAGLQATVDDIVQTFDHEVYPQALGRVLDVDRDGRFTILLTGWLGKLCNGKVALGGFVRGSDFYRDLAAPFGNRCDMMYLNAELKPGPYLHTLLAHEYTHAVVFSEHVFGDYLSEGPRQDEESWLNEALAHLNEERHGYSWSNLDYRISAYLNAPERQPLVVPDSYSAGLWRSPGHRGAAYLFLRWCTSHSGPELPVQLIQTNLSGVENLQTATEERFADLFRGWTAEMAVAGTGMAVQGSAGVSRQVGNSSHETFNLRGAVGARLLCGPRFEELSLNGGHGAVQLAGTAAAYFLLHSPGGERTRLVVAADSNAELQVSLIRVPARTGRLSLRVEKSDVAGTIRLLLDASDSAVVLNEAAWEKQTPAANRSTDTSYRPGEDGSQVVRQWFGDPVLRPGTTRSSEPIAVPEGNGPVVFKISATDEAGHKITAWGLVP